MEYVFVFPHMIEHEYLCMRSSPYDKAGPGKSNIKRVLTSAIYLLITLHFLVRDLFRWGCEYSPGSAWVVVSVKV